MWEERRGHEAELAFPDHPREPPRTGARPLAGDDSPSTRYRSCMTRVLLLVIGCLAPLVVQAQLKTRNVVLIVTDGLRWQEVFRGAERALISQKPGGVRDTALTRRAFWRDDVKERRAALLPFFWSTIAKEGVLLGNQDAGHRASITNTMKFLYPGYNEIFTGSFDPRIDSNDYPPNPNVTVFEYALGLLRSLLGRGPGGAGPCGRGFRRRRLHGLDGFAKLRYLRLERLDAVLEAAELGAGLDVHPLEGGGHAFVDLALPHHRRFERLGHRGLFEQLPRDVLEDLFALLEDVAKHLLSHGLLHS